MSYRKLPKKEQLPFALYTAEQVQRMDNLAINNFQLDALCLMETAGSVAFAVLMKRWPKTLSIGIVCAKGNNGGDGFVVGTIALNAGLKVFLMLRDDPHSLGTEADASANKFVEAGGIIRPLGKLPHHIDVLVDALWGVELNRSIEGKDKLLLEYLNGYPAPILAIDMPSGLNANTGRIMGEAVKADVTVTFIGLKQGLYTGQGREYAGDIVLDTLDIPAKVYASEILSARRYDWRRLNTNLLPRKRDAHKGNYGHVLLVGGKEGCLGAMSLAAQGALRIGAGLVSVATHVSHANLLSLHQPEIVSQGVVCAKALHALIEKADVIVIGMGLGQTDWAKQLLATCMNSDKPMVMDADALNLLAKKMVRRENWILTPHPKEASRLLQNSVVQVEADRFSAVELMQRRYGGVVVLKGAGTLVKVNADKPVAICSDGNPGMASAGMGDLLSGIIGGWVAQGMDLEEAALMGVCVHAATADQASQQGERGLLASDVLAEIRGMINPEYSS